MLNTISYLRRKNGLTCHQLAVEIGLTDMDICRAEKLNLNCGIDKFLAIGNFFGISLDTIFYNNIVDIITSQLERPLQSISSKKQARLQAARNEIGNTGEEIALIHEIKRHLDAGATDVSFIDPTAADKPSNGYDITSKTLDNKELLIEVKSSKGGLESPFYISSHEVEKAEWAKLNDVTYLIYRVIYTNDEDKTQISEYTLDELRELCEWKPTAYKLTFKEKT